jgi:hypothetical protein
MSTHLQRLAKEDHHAHRKEVELLQYLKDFWEIFEKKEFDMLPPWRVWDHAIKLMEGAEHRLSCKIYHLSRPKQEELDHFLQENLQMGHI